MLNLHRDKKSQGVNRGEMGRSLNSDHRQDGNDEVHRLEVRLLKKKKKKKKKCLPGADWDTKGTKGKIIKKDSTPRRGALTKPNSVQIFSYMLNRCDGQQRIRKAGECLSLLVCV